MIAKSTFSERSIPINASESVVSFTVMPFSLSEPDGSYFMTPSTGITPYATILPDPFLSMAKASGLKEIAKSDPKTYQTTILGVDKKLGDDKATLAKLTTAYNKAVAQINKHKASDYQEILTKDLGFPEVVAKNYTLPHYEKAGRVPAKMLQAAFNYAKEEGILKNDIDASHYQLPVAK